MIPFCLVGEGQKLRSTQGPGYEGWSGETKNHLIDDDGAVGEAWAMLYIYNSNLLQFRAFTSLEVLRGQH